MNLDEIKTRAPGSDAPYDPPGWVHYIWLIYVGFLFTPAFSGSQDRGWLWPTLISLPVFVILYARIVRTFRRNDPPASGTLLPVLTIALLAYALLLVNDSANTYLIYCVALAPYATPKFRRLVVLTVLLLAGYGLELLLLGFRPLVFGMTALAGIAAAATNYVLLENRRKNVALRRSSEEVQRLARVAERERIGRDLHDLLGHTLSLIAIKSELAAKLLERDRVAAAREITDVTNIAREALKQVRSAVTGIRAAALEGELASARLLLEITGVSLTYEHDGALLPAEVETTLAMIVREAVTNIQRHAGARRALIRVSLDEGAGENGGSARAEAGDNNARAGTGGSSAGFEVGGGSAGAGGARAGAAGYGKAVLLYVSDDGRGGITAQGNGLSGIAERVKSLGGTLHIESPQGKGSVVCVRLPLGPSSPRSEQPAAVSAPGGAVSAGTVVSAGAMVSAARGGSSAAAGAAGAETPLVSTSTVVQT